MSGFRIRTAAAEDIRDICALWGECFGNRPECERLFRAAGGEIETALLCRHDGSIAGMAPAVSVHMGELRGVYLFGVCVSRNDRGRGGMRRLIGAAFDSAAARDMDFLTLIPATEELSGAYRRIMPGAWDGRQVAVPRFTAPAGQALSACTADVEPAGGRLTVTPGRGFSAFLRSFFTPMMTPEGDFLLCGEKNDAGERKIYEYVKHYGSNCDTIRGSDSGFYGLIAPLGGCVLPEGRLAYACTMGEE